MIDNKDNDDKNNPHDFEEEFDFDANEIFDETEGSQIKSDINQPNQLPPMPPGPERSKLPLLIGLAIAGFVGWKIYGWVLPPKPDAELEKAAAQEQAAITATEHTPAPATAKPAAITHPAPVAAPAPARPAAQAAAPAPAPHPALAAPVPVIAPAPALIPAAPVPAPAPVKSDAQIQEEIKHLEHLEATVNQAMDYLNKMDQKMSLIGREFFAVSDNVTKLSQEMAQIKGSNKPAAATIPAAGAPTTMIPAHKPARAHHPIHKKPKTYRKIQPVYNVQDQEEQEEQESDVGAPHRAGPAQQPNPDLLVHAIIPGRAWLRSPDGSTLTVMEGDVIPGYGKVMVIDAPSSTVVTSSGVVLR